MTAQLVRKNFRYVILIVATVTAIILPTPTSARTTLEFAAAMTVVSSLLAMAAAAVMREKR